MGLARRWRLGRQRDPNRPRASLRGDHGVHGIEGDVELRRHPAGQELAERCPVRFLGQRDDELDAAAGRRPLVAQRLHAVDRRRDRSLVVLHTATEQSARLRPHVEAERVGGPRGLLRRPHVRMRDETQTVVRFTETQQDRGAVVLELEPQLGGLARQIALQTQELRVAGIGQPWFGDRPKRDQIGQRRDDGVEVACDRVCGDRARHRGRSVAVCLLVSHDPCLPRQSKIARSSSRVSAHPEVTA